MRYFSCQHLKSPSGVLRIIHVVFGAFSLTLACIAYIPVWKVNLFLGAVSLCLAISVAHLIILAAYYDVLRDNKINKIFNLVFHVIGGMMLVMAGIDLDGWSSYDLTCGQPCPHMYTIGVAKILTFINGTLYGIAGCFEAKEDETRDDCSEVLPIILTPSPYPHYGVNTNVICMNTS